MASRAVIWILAGVVAAIVFVYHLLRLMATGCAGAGCDWYIPFSLFLPILAIVLAALTAGLAAFEARARKVWSAVIGTCGVLASVGSILAALALSDNDTKVWLSTGLVLSVPLSIAFSAVRKPTTISS